jgi:hypothetical protein
MKKLLLAAVMMTAVAGAAPAQDFPKWDVFGGYSVLNADMDGGGQNMNYYYYDVDFARLNEGTNGGMLNGFDLSLTRNLNSWLGIKGNFSTHFGKVDLENAANYGYAYDYDYNEYNNYQQDREESWAGKADYRRYTGMVGPEFSYRGNSKVRPFAHALFGFTKVKADDLDVAYDYSYEYGYDGTVTDWYEYTGKVSGKIEGDTSFAMALGGGLDVKAGKHAAIRLIQVDYLPTWDKLTYDAAFVGREEEDGDYSRDYMEYYSHKAPSSRFNNVKLSFGVVISF